MNQALQKESLNWSESMNFDKRLSAIENRLNPKERPCAWLAIVELDGKVSASHVEHGNHEFKNIEAFDVFRESKGIVTGDYIQVVIVNAKDCKGEDPKDL